MRRNRMRNIAAAVRNRGQRLERLDSYNVSGWIADVLFSLVIVKLHRLFAGDGTMGGGP